MQRKYGNRNCEVDKMDQMISVERVEHIASLFGLLDENLRLLSNEYGVMITNRDEQIKISGEPENTMQAKQAVEALLQLIMRGEEIDTQRVNYVISMVRDGRQDQINQMGKDVICVTMRGKPVKAKTVGQQKGIYTRFCIKFTFQEHRHIFFFVANMLIFKIRYIIHR